MFQREPAHAPDVQCVRSMHRIDVKTCLPVEQRLAQQTNNHTNTDAKETHAHELDCEAMHGTENDRERLEGEVENTKEKGAPAQNISTHPMSLRKKDVP